MSERPDVPDAEDDAEETEDPPAVPAVPGRPPDPPESPFTTETIKFMSGQLLAVVLRGGPVGARFVPTGVAGPFLYRFDELVRAIAARVAGRELGGRGSLPTVPEAGLFSLTDVAWGHSVTFRLSLGGDEQSHMLPSGEISSITDEVLTHVETLVTTAAAGDAAALWKTTRDLGGRVGKNYERLLEVFIQRDVDSVWKFREESRSIDLSTTRSARAKGILDQTDVPAVQEKEMHGFLYRVDSREHTFLLDPEGDDEEKITGTYPEHLREALRNAWDHEVVVHVRTTHHFLTRQTEPSQVDYELIEIDDIVE